MLLFKFTACALILIASASSARAERLYALLNNDPSIGQHLVTINTDTRAVESTVVLQTANTLSPLASIDVRPATGELFGYDATGRQLYTINATSGALTAVGAQLPAGSGELIDFNPTVDRVRLVGTANQNLRLNPNDGTIAGTDTTLAFAAGDVNEGATPNIRGIGYTNSFAGAATTTLYDIDVDRDILVTQNPANNGLLQTVGALGVDLNSGIFGSFNGFDISGVTGVAYLTDGAFAGPSNLYTVNLATGAATSLGAITGLPDGRTVASIAVAAVPEPGTLTMTLTSGLAIAALVFGRNRSRSSQR